MTTPRIVPGEGPPSAKLVILGEAPGREEDLYGRPFCGASGKLLNALLADCGLYRHDIYVDNVFQTRPPNNEVDHFYLDTRCTRVNPEYQHYIDKMWRTIDFIRPNVILALGRTPMFHLTGHDGIGKWRGSILHSSTSPDGRVYKVIPSYHPAATFKESQKTDRGKKKMTPIKPLIIFDILKAKAQMDFPDLRTIKRDFTIRPTYDQTITELQRLQICPRVSFDIETDTYRNVSCIGFSDNYHNAFCIPFVHEQGNYWDFDQEKTIWQLIASILEDPTIEKVGQFVYVYDIPLIMRKNRIFTRGLWMDTSVAHHELYSDFYKGLDLQVSIYTNEEYYKDEGKQWKNVLNYDQYWIYNCKDAAYTMEISDALERELKTEDLWSNFLESMSFAEPLMAATMRGIAADLRLRGDIFTRHEALLKQAQEDLNTVCNDDVNVKSADQMRRLLYGHLGLPLKTNRKTGKPTSDEGAIADLRRKEKNPTTIKILDSIITVRKERTFIENFAELALDPWDDRIRCTYLITGTVTWRLSSNTSPFGSGRNLQNIPRRGEFAEVRRTFMADPGYVILEADQEQAEDRVVAWLSRSEIRMENYRNGIDGHWDLVGKVFPKYKGVTYDKNDPELFKVRYLCKKGRHATNYAMGPIRFMMELAKEGFYFELSACKAILGGIKSADPALEGWHRNVQSTLLDTRTLVTPLGKRRYFWGPLFGGKAHETFESGYAFVPQCTVGHITNKGLKRIYWELCQTSDVDLLMQVHDSVVVQVREDLVPQVAKKIVECMTIPLEIHGQELIIPIEVSVGPTWGDLKKIKVEV